MKRNLIRLLLCAMALLLCISSFVFTAIADDPAPEPTPDPEPTNFMPAADGSLLLEITNLAAKNENTETGAVYTQAFGETDFYSYDEETGKMNSLTIAAAADTHTYGGKTNLLLGEGAKYTVSYQASLGEQSGGLRIAYAENSNSIGFYALNSGTQACLAWGGNTSPGYSGYKSYTAAMSKRGGVYGGGFAKFDLEINGYVISGYVNDALLFREDIRNPSNPNAAAAIAKDFMSETLCIVWHEYTSRPVNSTAAVGDVNAEFKDIKIYAGLLHQEVYDLGMIGMQTGTVADGVCNVRFVAGGKTDTYKAAGFEITAVIGEEKRVFEYETEQVVRKLTVPTEDHLLGEVTAESQNVAYLFGYTITGVPEDQSIRMIVRPYVLCQGTRMYGVGATYIIGFESLELTGGENPMQAHFSDFFETP